MLVSYTSPLSEPDGLKKADLTHSQEANPTLASSVDDDQQTQDTTAETKKDVLAQESEQEMKATPEVKELPHKNRMKEETTHQLRGIFAIVLMLRLLLLILVYTCLAHIASAALPLAASTDVPLLSADWILTKYLGGDTLAPMMELMTRPGVRLLLCFVGLVLWHREPGYNSLEQWKAWAHRSEERLFPQLNTEPGTVMKDRYEDKNKDNHPVTNDQIRQGHKDIPATTRAKAKVATASESAPNKDFVGKEEQNAKTAINEDPAQESPIELLILWALLIFYLLNNVKVAQFMGSLMDHPILLHTILSISRILRISSAIEMMKRRWKDQNDTVMGTDMERQQRKINDRGLLLLEAWLVVALLFEKNAFTFRWHIVWILVDVVYTGLCYSEQMASFNQGFLDYCGNLMKKWDSYGAESKRRHKISIKLLKEAERARFERRLNKLQLRDSSDAVKEMAIAFLIHSPLLANPDSDLINGSLFRCARMLFLLVVSIYLTNGEGLLCDALRAIHDKPAPEIATPTTRLSKAQILRNLFYKINWDLMIPTAYLFYRHVFCFDKLGLPRFFRVLVLTGGVWVSSSCYSIDANNPWAVKLRLSHLHQKGGDLRKDILAVVAHFNLIWALITSLFFLDGDQWFVLILVCNFGFYVKSLASLGLTMLDFGVSKLDMFMEEKDFGPCVRPLEDCVLLVRRHLHIFLERPTEEKYHFLMDELRFVLTFIFPLVMADIALLLAFGNPFSPKMSLLVNGKRLVVT